ncbi:MAG: hypothetical protein ABL949_07150 [Fimbriimonadaceae bacterium]
MDDFKLSPDQVAFLSAIESRYPEAPGTLTGAELTELLANKLPDSIRNANLQALNQSSDNRKHLVKLALADRERIESRRYSIPLEPSIVGRTEEQKEIIAMLGNRTRLVNIVGTGGIGKSRLARAVGEKLTKKGLGTFYFTDQTCQSVSDLKVAMALALGSPVLDSDCPVEATMHALLIVDGVPGTAGFAEFFEDLINSTLNVIVLCTSRVPISPHLGTIYQLGSLKHEGAPGKASEAVSLLLRRARATRQHTADLSAERLGLVAKRLSGIPLALGLAAGCLARQSFEDFEVRFENAGRSAFVQSERSTTATPLRQILMHSFSTLSPHERHVLRCISVLSGQFSLDDALFVGSPAKATPDDLEHLVGCGFVESADVDNQAFRIHDAILEFLMQSEPSIEEIAVHTEAQSAHLNLFANRAQELGTVVAEGKWESGLGAIFEKSNDFRKATKYAQDQEEATHIAQLADGLARTYFEAGFLSDFEMLTNAACESARKSGDFALLSRMLGLQGALASRRSESEVCERLWQERLEIARSTGDVHTASDALTDLAWHAYEQKAEGMGLQYLDEAESLARNAGIPELVATAQVIRARIANSSGQASVARTNLILCEESLKSCSDRDLLVFVYQGLSIAYEELSEFEKAQHFRLKLLTEAVNGHRVILIGWTLRRLAPRFEQSGNLDLAAQGLVAASKVHAEYDTQHRELATLELQDFENRYGRSLGTELAAARTSSWQSLVQTILDRAFHQ